MTEMCREVRDAIALEGRAPDKESLRQHSSECAKCARFLKSVLAVEDELGALATADVDDAVVEKLLARPELSFKSSSHKFRWAMGLAAAAMIAFVAARVTLIGQKDPTLYYPEEPAVNFNSAVGAGASSESDDRLVGDELSSGERESSQSLGTVDALESSELADGQRRELRRNKVQFEDQEKLREDVEELNKHYSRAGGDLDAALVESKNEPAKKDGSLSQAAAAPASPMPESERLAEGQIFGGLLDAPEQQQSPYSETISVPNPSPSVDSSGFAGDKGRTDTGDFRTRLVEQDAVGGLYDLEPGPKKLDHVDAVYPESGKQQRVTGTVVLRVVIDRTGTVTQVTVVDSVAALDQAAIDAVLQWKYEASEKDQRSVIVRIAFDAPAKPNSESKEDARLFLEERERVENLHFRDARGYWANTYLPGDPRTRFLAMRLGHAHQVVAPHSWARPVAQPFDAPSRGALSVSLHADRRGVSGEQRLLLQVGVKATENYGRRRPPMNVGIVLDADPDDLAGARALLDSLEQAKALGDRFRLIVPGKGEVVSPDAFRHGALTVALDELDRSSDLESAVRLAVKRVYAGDDPTMPLGSSLVLVITPRKLGRELDAISRLAHQSAIGGVPVSVVGIGAGVDRNELERIALSGQGRRYFLEQSADATGIVDRELAASSRVVARALRLRIKLAAGVKLVDVIGSESLSERQAERVREAEKSIDLRLSRNLGIEADRGEDEDGIQIVIPSFYAGDTHTILLDVVVDRPGAIAEVTARYKDLSELRNTVSKASLSLPRSELAPGPLETNVLKNYLSYLLSEELESAADELDRGDRAAAVVRLNDARALLAGLGFGNDTELARDIAMLGEYVSVLSSSLEPALISYLVDSLRYAGASKRRLPAVFT